MSARRIHLIFKTHLDIGFTDHAEKVRAQYHERFIPQAIETGEQFFAEDPEHPQFIWTTGAWLIWDHLNSQPKQKVARLERAIGRGLIRWHALPFTTHSELMSPALFRAGLSYAQELDRQFGVTTTAAKMTDVPGHTLGIVPLLAAAGVKFLHLGVNTASPPPEVPELFRWRAPDGSEVVVLYQKSYGATHLPQGFDEGLSFAHTADNIGPQSVPQAVEAIRALREQHPHAEITASTLDAYGELLWARRAELPVVDLELGDSWIHGAASDPIKMADFLALQRLYDRFDEAKAVTPARLAFARRLTLVAEHTWGVDIKSWLRDEQAWDRPAFEAARATDRRFAYAEASWAEQRSYLDDAVAQLEAQDRQLAEGVLRAQRPGAAARAGSAVPEALETQGWRIAFDAASGDLTEVTAPDGRSISGRGGSLMGYRYESYDAGDVAAHLDSYLTHREPWAILDHCKPGLERASTARSARFAPRLAGADGSVLVLALPELAGRELGAPRQIEIAVAARSATALEIAVTLRDKLANRMPEASFVTLTPAESTRWEFCKMGLWQPGDRVAAMGGGQLQAVSAVRGGGIEVEPVDTPLVGPAGMPFMPFCRTPPDLGAGLRFNLHNNKWGTNFPMWWEGTLVARFVLRMAAE
jgi:hypothetical protein